MLPYAPTHQAHLTDFCSMWNRLLGDFPCVHPSACEALTPLQSVTYAYFSRYPVTSSLRHFLKEIYFIEIQLIILLLVFAIQQSVSDVFVCVCVCVSCSVVFDSSKPQGL